MCLRGLPSLLGKPSGLTHADLPVHHTSYRLPAHNIIAFRPITYIAHITYNIPHTAYISQIISDLPVTQSNPSGYSIVRRLTS